MASAIRIDNAGQVMLIAQREPDYDDNDHAIEGSADTELDAYWIGASLRNTEARDVDPINLSDDDLGHLPLEAPERVTGPQTERKRQREKALVTHVVGIDRETRRRNELEREYREPAPATVAGPTG